MSRVLANPDLRLVLVEQGDGRILLGELEKCVQYDFYEPDPGEVWQTATYSPFNLVGKAKLPEEQNPSEYFTPTLESLVGCVVKKLSIFNEKGNLENYLTRKGFKEYDWDDKEQEKFLQQHGVQYDARRPNTVQVKLTPYPLLKRE